MNINKNKNRFMKGLSDKIFIATCSSFVVCNNAVADLKLSANSSLTSVYQDISSEENGNDSFTTFSVNPTLNASYQSKTINSLWQGKVTYLERGRNEDVIDNTYGEYNYKAIWSPLGDVFLVSASGALKYQNAQSGNFLVSDFFTNAEALTKSRSNRFAITGKLERGSWIRGDATLSYSDVASEPNIIAAFPALDNDTYFASGELSSGKDAKYVLWQITGTFQSTDRLDRNQGNFVTRTSSAFVDVHLLGNWAVRINGNHEGNQISSADNASSIVRTFNSYGAGLTYRQSENRFASITTNISKSDAVENNNISFIGLDVQWALTERTGLSIKYGRRFFGETASASLKFNSRALRTAFTYTEDVTNASRLLSNPENLGVFVCPVNSISISNCFQPNSLNYSPNADEQLVQFSNQNIDINDNVIIRKSSNLQLSYDFSRVTVGGSFRYSEDDALEQDRLIRTYSFESSVYYRVGTKTRFGAEIEAASITQRSETFSNGESDNFNLSFNVEHSITKNLLFKTGIDFVDRKGDNINAVGSQNGLFGANFESRRISISLNYSFN